MIASGLAGREASADPAAGDGPAAATRPVVLLGVIGAAAAAAVGLAAMTLLVLAGWIAAPHGGTGLTGVLRAAGALWLIGHHVGFGLRGAGRIGMLPLGLVLLPGALVWRAGHWVARTAGLTRLRQAGCAALALAIPYGLLAAGTALASRSAVVTPSMPQAALAGFALALISGGLGCARGLAPWAQLAGLVPARLRSVLAGAAAALAVLSAAGAVLAGIALGTRLHAFSSATAVLAPGMVGSGLLLLAQLAYLPNAVVWAMSVMVGPGFAFGVGTTVAPTGSALGALPQFPLLAALPPGAHAAFPPWLTIALLAVPYLAGAVGGLLLARTAPTPVLEAAPGWGFACGALAGCVLGAVAALAGGPLGDGRLTAVGPSGWQVAAAAGLEMGVTAALTAGAANWLRFRGPARAARRAGSRDSGLSPGPAGDLGHTIYVDPWAGDDDRDEPAAAPPMLP